MNMRALKGCLSKVRFVTIGFLLVLAAPNLSAQSVTVFGSVEEARICMLGAELASKMRVGSRRDVETCTTALQNGRLTHRDRAATYCNRGIIKAAMRLDQEAFEDYNVAIDMLPDLAEPYIGRGNIYFLADRLNEAIQDYNKAMELDLGRLHIAHLNRGLAYEAQGNLDQAEADYRKALELAPEWKLAQEKLDGLNAKRQATKPRGALL